MTPREVAKSGATRAPTEETVAGGAPADALRAHRLINAYRCRGHLAADLDPLGLHRPPTAPDLSPEFHGFLPRDQSKIINLDGEFGLQQASLKRVLEILRRAYCGSLTLEYDHIQDLAERRWLKEQMEQCFEPLHFSKAGKRAILKAVVAAEEFEAFLQRKFPAAKRFGLEGGEACIPAIEQVIKRGQKLGLCEMVIGMAHRGRLNVLANVMRKPLAQIFAEFRGLAGRRASAAGDIKYHLGAVADRKFESGDAVHLSLAPNPSHLEVVNPVALGRVRGRQLQLMRKSGEGSPARGVIPKHKVMPLLIHGDASFAGQGIVMEILDLSQLRGYRCGGAIHLIINNQIGFTTSPADARSSPYCSDVAKGVMAPVFHANGNDPEAVVRAARLAVEYRQRFAKDVVIDVFCYRRHGHDEMEDASITQPMMYKKIKTTKPVSNIYARRLIREGVIEKDRLQITRKAAKQALLRDFKRKDFTPPPPDWLKRQWRGIRPPDPKVAVDLPATGLPAKTLKRLARKVFSLPADFKPHKIVGYEGKMSAVRNGEYISWGTAELLAFAGLLDRGFSVRLSGEDSGRGTFAQRHATVINQKNGDKILTLEAVNPKATCEVLDSPLSEAGVLGFEYGFSGSSPHTLVIWEAQYGDFANGAQVVIDQFVASGEAKWDRLSGLVMLLPHGYEGQGAEHSSGRLERFLTDSADNNWLVTMCSTPANHFHAMMRQMLSKTRKPMVALTPKKLQKPAHHEEYRRDGKNPHLYCVSPFSRFCPEENGKINRFEPLIDDPNPPKRAERLILCSGKIYYELARQRAENHPQSPIRLVRLELLYPLPLKQLQTLLKTHSQAETVWVQEEPANMGAAAWLKPRLEELMGGKTLKVVSRPPSSTPATGSAAEHIKEQCRVLKEAFN